MKERFTPGCVRLALAAVALSLAVGGTVWAQSGTARGSGAPAAPHRPRVKVDPDTGLPPGMPDLRGVWTNRWIVNMADGRFVEKTVEVPFTEKGRRIYAERTGNFQRDDPNFKCWPSGLPRQGGTPYPLKIMQTPEEVVFLYEGGMHTFRIVPTDGRSHKKDAWVWYGDSVGRWEGDTLVVESNNFVDGGWLDVWGSPLTDEGKITERFTRPRFGELNIAITIDDPKAYTEPFTVGVTQRIMVDQELIEFICNEYNRAIEHVSR